MKDLTKLKKSDLIDLVELRDIEIDEMIEQGENFAFDTNKQNKELHDELRLLRDKNTGLKQESKVYRAALNDINAAIEAVVEMRCKSDSDGMYIENEETRLLRHFKEVIARVDYENYSKQSVAEALKELKAC